MQLLALLDWIVKRRGVDNLRSLKGHCVSVISLELDREMCTIRLFFFTFSQYATSSILSSCESRGDKDTYRSVIKSRWRLVLQIWDRLANLNQEK